MHLSFSYCQGNNETLIPLNELIESRSLVNPEIMAIRAGVSLGAFSYDTFLYRLGTICLATPNSESTKNMVFFIIKYRLHLIDFGQKSSTMNDNPQLNTT